MSFILFKPCNPYRPLAEGVEAILGSAETSWLDMGDVVAKSFGRDPRLEHQLEKDTKTTHRVLDDYQKTGRKLKAVELDEELEDNQPAHSPRLSHGKSVFFQQRIAIYVWMSI